MKRLQPARKKGPPAFTVISKEHANSWHRISGASTILPSSRVRVWPFIVGLFAAAGILWGRLSLLTVVEGAYQRQQADENRIAAVRQAAPRGILFDRNGVPLVRNVPAYKRQLPGTSVFQAQFEPIDRDQAIALSHSTGERVFFDIKREYLCGRPCANILGYLGEITAEELAQTNDEYVMGDMVGKSGLEKMYEKRLRGQPGSELVEVDARGMSNRVLGKVEQQPGVDLHLTIDSGLQKVLYEAFEGRPGAAVAQVPQTGEILALVTSPAFDPTSLGESLKESGKPFFNRALSGAYPPGSIFKIVTAMAGLEEGKVEADTIVEDTGEIKIDEYRFGNWFYDQYGRVDGSVDVIKALQRSNDIYFYTVGGKIGPNKLAEWAHLFGFGEVSTLAPLGEVAGLIPNPSWKERVLGERWYLGNTFHMSIGQGDVLVTPLQGSRMMAAIAAGGNLCDPLLLRDEVGKKSCVQLNLEQKHLEAVQSGLAKACESGGTGAPFFSFEPRVACKTGTAQQGGEKDDPHAWFTVYAPATAPEIELTVMLEKAGQGSEVAAPVAKKALEYWFHQR